MDRLEARNLLEFALKSADSMLLTAKKLEAEVEKGEITANNVNALINAYRSAGQLYFSMAQAVKPPTIQNEEALTELSQADRERLDNIAKLLSDKPSKRGKRKKQED